jgi:hypothetical protein
MKGWTDRCGEADRHIFATFHCECTRNDVVVVVVAVVVVAAAEAVVIVVVVVVSWLLQISVMHGILSDKIHI